MANNFFTGSAFAIAQVDTFVVGGAYADGQTYTVTVDGKSVTYTSVSGDTNVTVCAALLALLINTLVASAEFSEATWTSDANLTITATMTVPGMPSATAFTSSASGTGTLVHTAVTAATGPSDWNNTANWSLGATPVATNDVYIESSNIPILYNLSHAAVTLNSLNIAASYTGQIGNPRFNSNGYLESRGTYLLIAATTINIGYGQGTGSSLIKINTGSVQTLMNISQTDSPTEAGLGSVQFLGTHASNVINIVEGNLSVGLYGGEAATVLTLRVGYLTNVQTDAFVNIGAGVTLGTLTQYGGTVWEACTATTVNSQAGLLYCTGTSAYTTLNATGGSVTYMSSGTITTLLLSNGGAIDFSQDPRGRTITNTVNVYKGSRLNDPNKTVTFGGSPSSVFVGCTNKDVDVNVGRDVSYTFA